MSAKHLIPETRLCVDSIKNEAAKESGINFTQYKGNLTSKECGDVVKKMIEQFEKNL